jgi:dethiobiotin synthetase
MSIIAIAGTGTGIGKSHVAVAILLAMKAHGRVVGWKPVESGVTGSEGEDEARLRVAGTVPGPATVRLREAVAPNVAARREGIELHPRALAATATDLATRHDAVVVELAGGLFSPLTDTMTNASWLRTLKTMPRIILVAPDRLGVLHDTYAAVRAAAAEGLTIDTIVLSAPGTPDASTGSNAEELQRHLADCVHHTYIVYAERRPSEALATQPAFVSLAARILPRSSSANVAARP